MPPYTRFTVGQYRSMLSGTHIWENKGGYEAQRGLLSPVSLLG